MSLNTTKEIGDVIQQGFACLFAICGGICCLFCNFLFQSFARFLQIPRSSVWCYFCHYLHLPLAVHQTSPRSSGNLKIHLKANAPHDCRSKNYTFFCAHTDCRFQEEFILLSMMSSFLSDGHRNGGKEVGCGAMPLPPNG